MQEEAQASKELKSNTKTTSNETGAEKYKLGRAFRNATLSDWIASREDHESVLGWFTNKKLFITILGNPGTGKSYLCAAILNYLHEKNEEVAYITHRKFIEEIHEAIHYGKTQHSVLPKYTDKKYLIFDDLGSATCTDWQQEMILEVIDRRYANGDKTIFTTNFTKEDLKKKLGPRSASRLLDKHNLVLEFWSTDRRSDPTFNVGDFWK